jgi:hypothetical protein
MYAQVIQGGAGIEQRAEMDRIVTDELIPALTGEPGYAGAMNLVDRHTGHALTIVLWEHEDQARRPLREYGAACLRALASITAISSGQRQPISIWDVNAATV